MKIELSINELNELYASFRQVLDGTRDASYMRWRKECGGQEGRRPSGWVSHPVSYDNPPSVMTVATTGDGADFDIDRLKETLIKKELKAEKDADDRGHIIYERIKNSKECMERAARDDGFGGSLVRRLLDFEAWTDTICAGSDKFECVRFHHESYATLRDKLTLRCVAHYRNADRRSVPREVIFRKAVDLSKYDDESLADLADDLFYDTVASVSGILGADPEDYGRWLSHGVTPPEKGQAIKSVCEKGRCDG